MKTSYTMAQIRKQAEISCGYYIDFVEYVNGSRTYRIEHKENGCIAVPGVFTKSALIKMFFD